jgi:hypothetical protein
LTTTTELEKVGLGPVGNVFCNEEMGFFKDVF